MEIAYFGVPFDANKSITRLHAGQRGGFELSSEIDSCVCMSDHAQGRPFPLANNRTRAPDN